MLFKFRFEGGAHVNPLGPDGIMLSVVNYFVRIVAVVTLLNMVTKVTSVL